MKGSDIVAAFLMLGAFLKMRDMSPTVTSLETVLGVGTAVADKLAIGITMIEVVTAIWLISRRYTTLCVFATSFLLCIFTLYLLFLLLSGYDIPCGCGMPKLFGSARVEQVLAVFRNVFLFSLLRWRK